MSDTNYVSTIMTADALGHVAIHVRQLADVWTYICHKIVWEECYGPFDKLIIL